MNKQKYIGHFLAFSSVFLWSVLYVSVKILLEYLNPLELLFIQFLIGYIFLLLLKPKYTKYNIKEELLFACAGLSGITVYNLFLNLSMEYTSPSHVSIIIATAPLFTALIAFIFKLEKINIKFFIGFILALAGIIILNLKDFVFLFNILGNLFALISTLGWAVYAIFVIRITHISPDIITTTRKILFYGIICILPSFYFLDFSPDFYIFLQKDILINMLFVALFASAICFIMWNKATLLIGAIKTNIYVYLTPAITMITSFIILKDAITLYALLGMLFILLGVFIAES